MKVWNEEQDEGKIKKKQGNKGIKEGRKKEF
jgi:hypothetical protein